MCVSDCHDMTLAVKSGAKPHYNQPINKILDWSKLNAVVYDYSNVELVQMIISVFDWVEKIVGKRENASYQHFLLFSQCFQRVSSLGLLNV